MQCHKDPFATKDATLKDVDEINPPHGIDVVAQARNNSNKKKLETVKYEDNFLEYERDGNANDANNNNVNNNYSAISLVSHRFCRFTMF